MWHPLTLYNTWPSPLGPAGPLGLLTASVDPLGFSRAKNLSPRVRAMDPAVKELIITGSPDPGGPITITKPGGEAWLTVPAQCTSASPFNVTVDPALLSKETVYRSIRRRAVLTFSRIGYDDMSMSVEIEIKPGGIRG